MKIYFLFPPKQKNEIFQQDVNCLIVFSKLTYLTGQDGLSDAQTP